MLHQIKKEDLVSDIVIKDYRTAVVFWKYDIDFCCGGKWPLEKACAARGLNTDTVRSELDDSMQCTAACSALTFRQWNLNFLTNYITHVHHEYLKTLLPLLNVRIPEFVERHRGKYSHLPELQVIFERLSGATLPHLVREEEITFPYIRQMEYAYNNKEAYAGLLVRTLNKPVEEVIRHIQQLTTQCLVRIREITGNYNPPPNACITHKVAYAMLRELDGNLSQHLYLENDILLPRAIALENELLLQAG